MASDDRSQLLRQVELGLDAQRFKDSDIGRELQDRANAEVEAALEQLKTVDPTDAKQITLLQNHIWKAETFLLWINEMVQEGVNAEEQLEQEEQT